MKLLIIIIAAVVAAVALLAGIVAIIGSRLPKTHVASRSILLHQSPQNVYRVVRDFGSTPKWRPDVKQVDVELQQGGPAERMVTRIRDTDLGYSGQWTYVLAPENGGTRVTITEDGEVSNVLFRF